MNKLNVIRASAGSGKTHYLTGFYLKTIMGREIDYFKKILAVTFTNKATGEMKSRIIEQLHVLASGERSDYMQLLQTSTGYDENRIRNKAGVLLKNILHGYSWFSIETIDSFFQQIIRAFTRELGMPGNYKIELDPEHVLEYAVDNLIDSIRPGSEILKWLIQYSEERIIEGRHWSIRNDLIKLGQEVFKEDFAGNSVALYHKISDRKGLSDFRDRLFVVVNTYTSQMKQFGLNGRRILNDNAIYDEDLYQKGRGAGPYFDRLANGDFKPPNSYVLKLLESPEVWPAKNNEKSKVIEQIAGSHLISLLNEIFEYSAKQGIAYNSALEVLKNIYALGILSDMYAFVVQYRHEQNSFILSDAPVFIDKIIDHNDTPFIYEKLGNRFSHFLIDEFQDTSIMQWKNFKPLISNSLSEGNDCLLVGDAKQSIYRWRNGDWEILTKRVFSEYPGELVSLEVLNTNWRSHENVVVFNNRLFKSVAELLDRQIKNIFEEAGMADGLPPEFSRIVYGDVEQMVSIGNRNKGFVNVQFVDREELKNIPELADNHLLEHINSLLSRGYDAGDIAIIVRNKRDGRDIADLIIDKNSKAYFVRPVSVISGESLFIGKSNAVNLVIAAIATLLDPTNSIMQGKLGYHLQVHRQMLAGDRETIRTVYTSLLPALRNNENHLPKDFADSGSKLISLPLYDMAESLIRIFSLGELSLEIPYLDAFLDMVHDFVKTNASDPVKFLEYWEEEGRFRSVPDNNSRDAVRIMTIHKAKGLEFKAVIVPECNWELDQKPRSVFWVKPGNKLFSYLPVLPLSYNQNLKATWFAGDYYNEYYKSNVDNVNLLYVACTRAIESLMVISPVNTQKNESRISNVGELLYAALVQQHNVNENGIFDAETLLFSYGEMNHPEGRHSRTNEMAITGMICKPVTERLFFNSYGYDFFEDTTGISGNKALKGITLHTILSKVRLAADISGAVEQAVFEGLIGDGEKADLLLHLEEGMRDMRVKRWFDGSGQIFNEAEILMPDGDTKRPDRVVIFQHSVHVIDYKFGAHSNIELHKRQVAGYMEILKLMGYENIEGYLWYLNSNRIEEI